MVKLLNAAFTGRTVLRSYRSNYLKKNMINGSMKIEQMQIFYTKIKIGF